MYKNCAIGVFGQLRKPQSLDRLGADGIMLLFAGIYEAC
jgi:hypothetical protein